MHTPVKPIENKKTSHFCEALSEPYRPDFKPNTRPFRKFEKRVIIKII
jgi:hypothetical protein